MQQLEGIVPVLLTTFDKHGEVDPHGLKKVISFLLNKTIAGLWVLGTGAEDMNLSFSERIQVARTVCETVNKKTPIMLGSSFFALKDTLHFIRETIELPFEAYHVMPYHPLMSLQQLEKYYKDIADFSEKPIWLYTSANWCQHIPPAFIERLKSHENIVGVKYSTSNSVDNAKVISLADENFQVLPAVVKQLIQSLAAGAQAFTTSEACSLPEPVIAIYDAFKNNDLTSALELQRNLNNYLESCKTKPKKHNFLKAAEDKMILQIRGICDHYTSSYYMDCDDDDKQEIISKLKEFGFPPFEQ